jgi:putative transposase
MTLYKNKYRIETTRIHGWDYSSDGNYFVTICVKDRDHLFGKIIKGKMQLNPYGAIVE